jgi:hypothetical protein
MPPPKKSPAKQQTYVNYVDPSPAGVRYNLAFHAKYGDNEQMLRGVDEAYFTFFHKEFPELLQSSSPWNGKTSSSRSCCKCDIIKQVTSMTDIVKGIYDFTFFAKLNGKAGKFGTIFISAHGNKQAVALPVAAGTRRVSIKEFAVGLTIDSLTKTPPPGWSQEQFDELRGPFLGLNATFAMLKKAGDWFDKDTLIRFWVCFLGAPPASGQSDPLKTFGKLLVPDGSIMLEAPKSFSVGNYEYYTGNPPGKYIYDNLKKAKQLHPDCISETIADTNKKVLQSDEQKEAIENFGKGYLRPAPPPDRPNSKAEWAPLFGLREENSNTVIKQGDWANFSSKWRRVTT